MSQLTFRGRQSLFKTDHQLIYLLSLTVLFWSIFDSIITYVTPLVITQQGFSETWMGLIYASSSLVGAAFDFLICRLFKTTYFRRMFLLMFSLCAIYPLILWQAKSLWLFLVAMGIWGIYWDLYGFGTFDFISRHTKEEDHSKGFGVITVFRSLGNIIAPIIAGLIVGEVVTWQVFAFSWAFLGISILLFLALLFFIKQFHQQPHHVEVPRKRNMFTELHLWKKISKKLLPVLFLTFYLFFLDAFFWTLAPLLAEHLNLDKFGGFFLAAYTSPALILGWFIGSITRKLGKKRSALAGLLIGCLILSFFSMVHGPIAIIVLTFVAALFINISLPAIDGAYADYISEANNVEGEIEGLEDFSFNLGYIFGPFCAGLFADLFGIAQAFSVLGILGVLVALLLLKFTPRHITLKIDLP